MTDEERLPGPSATSARQPRATGRVFLVGYRGSGKSTVAGVLAQRLGWRWVDADLLLEAESGLTIRQIFESEGEAGFRRREAKLLEELCGLQNCVVSTGGGAVLAEANRELLRRAGTIVWLRATVDALCQRLDADPGTFNRRPTLSVGGRAEIEQLLRQREPLYQAVADLVVDTTLREPAEVADEVLAYLSV